MVFPRAPHRVVLTVATVFLVEPRVYKRRSVQCGLGGKTIDRIDRSPAAGDGGVSVPNHNTFCKKKQKKLPLT